YTSAENNILHAGGITGRGIIYNENVIIHRISTANCNGNKFNWIAIGIIPVITNQTSAISIFSKVNIHIIFCSPGLCVGINAIHPLKNKSVIARSKTYFLK